MKGFTMFLLEKEKLLVHGTLIGNMDSIKDNWLKPKTGHLSKKFYGDNLDNYLFLTDTDNLKAAVTAIKQHIANKLKKSVHEVSKDDIRKYGLLVLTRPESPESVKKLNDDGSLSDLENNKYHPDEAPEHAEPGDYFTDEEMEPTGFVYGDSLVEILQNRGFIQESA